ncbi:MAG: tRNA (adenosine(37)-N6)-dimethylallyltransferase MiaA [Thermodesulfobacteriota bacterium]
MNDIKLVVILGPTASGKSRLALQLAEGFNAEIVSADSMQVYRLMDIGTAKPTEYDRKKVPHHLLDMVFPDEDYTAARYGEDSARVIDEINSRGKNIILVGGSGLYIKILTRGIFKGPAPNWSLRRHLETLESEIGNGYLYERLKEVDPVSAAKIHPNNKIRIIRALEVHYLTNGSMSQFQREHAFSDKPYRTLKLGLRKEREELYMDIDNRVDLMVDSGIEDETRGLLEKGYGPSLKPMLGLGYKEMVAYLEGRYSFSEAVSKLKKNTRNYAKRQMTWFRNEIDIEWFPYKESGRIVETIRRFLI